MGSLLTFQSCDFLLLVESQTPDWRIMQKLTDHVLCAETPRHRSANASQTRSSAAFQKQEGGARGNGVFPPTEVFRQLKTLLVLSFLTCPNVSTFHYLDICVEHLLCIKPPCVHVKLTFCY